MVGCVCRRTRRIDSFDCVAANNQNPDLFLLVKKKKKTLRQTVVTKPNHNGISGSRS